MNYVYVQKNILIHTCTWGIISVLGRCYSEMKRSKYQSRRKLVHGETMAGMQIFVNNGWRFSNRVICAHCSIIYLMKICYGVYDLHFFCLCVVSRLLLNSFKSNSNSLCIMLLKTRFDDYWPKNTSNNSCILFSFFPQALSRLSRWLSFASRACWPSAASMHGFLSHAPNSPVIG